MTDTGQLSMPLTEEYRIGRKIISGMKEEELRAAYLDALDREMVELYRKIPTVHLDKDPWNRDPVYVCGDDARVKFESWNPPPPEMLSRSFLGGLWQRRHWQTDGRTYTSATKGSHGNRLLIWRFSERLYREKGE